MIRCLGISIALLLLAGCDNTTAPEHLDNARGYFGQGDNQTAVIELKNALQKDPELAEARLLLGLEHARVGRYQDALREFERALDLGLEDQRLQPGLLESKNRLGRYQEVIGELEDRTDLPPDLAVLLGDAYVASEDLEKARPLYLSAVELAAGNRGLGTIAWIQGDTERAEHYLNRAVEIDPNDRQAWVRKGELALTLGSYPDAAAAFTRARDLPGGSLSGGLGLARTYLTENRLDEALAEVTAVLVEVPGLYLAHYVDALIKFRLDDVDGAEAALREVQRVVPDHTPSLYLMGAVKFRQGQLNQAEGSLLRYLARDRTNESAAKLLASIRMEKGDLAGTVEVLDPFLATSEDPQLHAMSGTAQLRQGKVGEATAILERAVELAPDAAAFRNQLALSLLSSGEEARAAAELESAIAVDQDQFQSDYLLAMLNLKNRDFATAEAAARAMVSKSPELPLSYNILGAALLGQGDEPAARKAFEEALIKAPDFLPAATNLARLDEGAGDAAQARGRYEGILTASPDHIGAHLALADLSVRTGDLGAAQAHLEAVIATEPDSLRGQIGLARLYLRQNRLEEAVVPAAAVLRIAPDLLDGLLLNADLALRMGDRQTARRHGERLQTRVDGGSDTALLLAVGAMQRRVGLMTLARRNLERAAERTDGPQAAIQHQLARLDLMEGQTAAARTRLTALQGISSGTEVRLLEAEILQAEGRTADALAEFAVLAGEGSREAVLRLAGMQLAGGEVEDARSGLESWLVGHPADAGARILLADALMRTTERSQAIAEYEVMAETGNPVVLNNLAWLYMESGDQRAIATAEKALDLAPDNADVADTLGWILVQFGQPERGISYIRQSSQNKPTDATVRYHLGVAYLEAGRTQAGRTALEEAIGLGEFPEIDDARRRLEALGAS